MRLVGHFYQNGSLDYYYYYYYYYYSAICRVQQTAIHNWLALKLLCGFQHRQAMLIISNAPHYWCCCPFLMSMSLFSLSICFPLLHSECHYHSYLTEAERRMSYYNGFNGYLQCDNLLPLGWYRFGGAAGTEMPTSCVGKNRCGTHAPGWLNGSHPRATDGIVRAKVCFHWSSDCCLWSANIRVRNCSGFYVYELVPPPNCHLRYCGNGGGKTYRRTINVRNSRQKDRQLQETHKYQTDRQMVERQTYRQTADTFKWTNRDKRTTDKWTDRPQTDTQEKKVKPW